MRVLAIDYGEKRIGVAVSDPLGYTAQGLPTLAASGKKDFLERLRELCKEYNVNRVIIGLPVNMDGSRGVKAKQITDLVPLIEEAVKVPVQTWDERLTSREAGRLMIQEGLSRRKQKMQSDRLAATLILQGYLESQRGVQKS